MDTVVTKYIEQTFGDRVVSLLYYGSQAFGGMCSKVSDYDFLLLLDEPRQGDLKRLGSLVQEHPKIDISLKYRSRENARGLTSFQQGSHGVFFLKYLAHTKCLLGENFYAKNDSLSFTDPRVKRSLLYQCEEYFFRLHSIYLKEQPAVWCGYFQKYLSRIMIDMLLTEREELYVILSKISRNDFVDMYVRKNAMFSEETKQLASVLVQEPIEVEQELLSLYESLYEDYITLHVRLR